LRFTLHRHPYGPVSACTDRPSGGDVHCGVQVGVVAVAARLAQECLVLAISWCTVPAARTRLPRVCRVDPLDPVFAVRGLGVEFRDRFFDALPAVRATHGSGKSLLKVRESPLRRVSQSWTGEQLSGRQRGGHGHATVDTNDRTSAGCRDRVRHDCDVPATQVVALDSVGLGRGQCAGDPEAHPAEPGSRLGQLPGLLNEFRRGAFAARPHRPLLESKVPHVPRVSAMVREPSGLRRCGIQAITGHASYPNSHRRHFCDQFEGRESRLFPALENGVPSRPI